MTPVREFADWVTAGWRVSVLAPHPDDFDVIGVTLRHLHQQGHPLDVAVLTTGASGVADGYRGASMPVEKRNIREKEQQASCRFFGLPAQRLTFLRLAEDAAGHLVANAANRDRLRAWLNARQPDLVFLPHGNDTNPDHQRTYALFREIVSGPVIACLNQDPKTIGLRIDLVTGFDEATAAWKAELLRFHDSQQQRNLQTRQHGFDERILRTNRQIAAAGGGVWPYAEGFEIEQYPAR